MKLRKSVFAVMSSLALATLLPAPQAAEAANVPDGDQAGYTTSGSLEQVVAVVPGDVCTFSMWVGKRADGAGNSGRWFVQLTTGGWYIQNVLHGSLAPQADEWVQYQRTFTVGRFPNRPIRLRLRGQWGFESYDLVELSCGGANLVSDNSFENPAIADGTFQNGSATGWATPNGGAGVFNPDTTQFTDSSCAVFGGSCTVFLTQTTTTGAIGGLAAADAICQGEADAANLGGIYKAWLSDSTTDARDRITQPTVPLVRPDGAVIWDDWADMVSGADPGSDPAVEIDRAADSSSITTVLRAWTGTVGPGTNTGVRGGAYCNNWTLGTGGSGLTGVPTSNPAPNWSSDSGQVCNNLFRLYCFEQ